MRCSQSKNTFANVVSQNVDDENRYCAKRAATDVEWLGHIGVILKTDNESSILAWRSSYESLSSCARTRT